MKCTICGTENLELISTSIRNAEGKVYYCDDCDLGLLKPKHTNVSDYYDQEYRKKFTDDIEITASDPVTMYNTHRKYQKNRINIIKPYFDLDKNFLEIGCSAGQFITHVVNEYAECVGLELDSRCAEYVKKEFEITVHRTLLEDSNIPEKSFDFIGSFQVLEHTLDPIRFLLDIKNILKDTGKIFIEVPNLYDPLLKLWNVTAYHQFYYHEAHTHYFSRKSLEKLILRCKLQIDDIFFLQDYNVFNHFYWYFNNKPQQNCDFGLSEPEIRFFDNKVGKKINELFQSFNDQYKKVLSNHELTSNIFLILSKQQ
jgi:2-polyprenyl-3-methyl-5-hydroxy-6-metoxy-1,4-benzoquinol methylase